MENPSMSKKEKSIGWILATKFHADLATKPESEVRLNPIMRDLIINQHVEKFYQQVERGKQSKWWKIGVRDEVVESIGENQLVWLNTMKE